MNLDIKKEFPIFSHHPEVVFLDNAATTQKPSVVTEAEKEYYETTHANIHRATYDLAAAATELFEGARQQIAAFIGAKTEEIMFGRNASEALNLVAYIIGQQVTEGSEILISVAGHHSNVLPWMRLAKEKNLLVKWIEIGQDGRLDIADLYAKLSDKTAVIALEHVSNVLGHVNPIADICAAAHKVGAKVVVDAAQSSCRLPIDVRELGADFVAFSGHKMYGPTGVGWLWAKLEYVQAAEPMLAGGGTIKRVTRENIEWADAPFRFEAGTPDIAGVIAMGKTIQFLEAVSMKAVWEHDQDIMRYALARLQALPYVRLFGVTDTRERAAIFSFLLTGDTPIHSHDVAEICNSRGVAIRGGHHCAQPLMQSLQVEDVNRASFGMYNTEEDVDSLIGALEEAYTTLTR